jgi:hypothetical protein
LAPGIAERVVSFSKPAGQSTHPRHPGAPSMQAAVPGGTSVGAPLPPDDPHETQAAATNASPRSRPAVVALVALVAGVVNARVGIEQDDSANTP